LLFILPLLPEVRAFDFMPRPDWPPFMLPEPRIVPDVVPEPFIEPEVEPFMVPEVVPFIVPEVLEPFMVPDVVPVPFIVPEVEPAPEVVPFMEPEVVEPEVVWAKALVLRPSTSRKAREVLKAFMFSKKESEIKGRCRSWNALAGIVRLWRLRWLRNA
jgi:hypothetical protein